MEGSVGGGSGGVTAGDVEGCVVEGSVGGGPGGVTTGDVEGCVVEGSVGGVGTGTGTGALYGQKATNVTTPAGGRGFARTKA